MTVKKRPPKRKAGAVKISPKQLTVQYSDTHDLLDKLLNVSQSLSRLHSHALLSRSASAESDANPRKYLGSAADEDALGPSAAYRIVSDCAGESDVMKKLGDIPGLDCAIFQSCVQTGVTKLGYVCNPFPCAPATTLWQVIIAIQGSPKA